MPIRHGSLIACMETRSSEGVFVEHFFHDFLITITRVHYTPYTLALLSAWLRLLELTMEGWTHHALKTGFNNDLSDNIVQLVVCHAVYSSIYIPIRSHLLPYQFQDTS